MTFIKIIDKHLANQILTLIQAIINKVKPIKYCKKTKALTNNLGLFFSFATLPKIKLGEKELKFDSFLKYMIQSTPFKTKQKPNIIPNVLL